MNYKLLLLGLCLLLLPLASAVSTNITFDNSSYNEYFTFSDASVSGGYLSITNTNGYFWFNELLGENEYERVCYRYEHTGQGKDTSGFTYRTAYLGFGEPEPDNTSRPATSNSTNIYWRTTDASGANNEFIYFTLSTTPAFGTYIDNWNVDCIEWYPTNSSFSFYTNGVYTQSLPFSSTWGFHQDGGNKFGNGNPDGSAGFSFFGYALASNQVPTRLDWVSFDTWTPPNPDSNFTITVTDEWTGNDLTNLNASLYFPGTPPFELYSNSSGNIIYTDQVKDGSLINFTLSSNGYFTKTFINYNVSEDLETTMFQSQINFSAYELITNDSLSDVNFTIDGQQNTTFFLNAGSHNVTASKEGYYDLVYEVTVVAGSNTTIDILGMYNAIINVTAVDNASGSSVSSFDITTSQTNFSYSNDLSTTTSYLEVPVLNNYTYNLLISSDDYVDASVNISVSNQLTNYTFNLFEVGSLTITFLNELTSSILTGTNITLDVISNSFSGSYSTTNGTLYIQNLTPQDYTLRYSANTYTTRFYYFSLVSDASENINLYMLGNSSANSVQITVVDQTTNPVEGAIVKAEKYFINSNSYVSVDQKKSDFQGLLVMDLDTEGELYRFKIELNGELVKTTDPSEIEQGGSNCDFYACLSITIIDGELAGTDIFEWQDIQGVITFNDDTDNFRLEYNNLNGNQQQVCLEVEKVRMLGNIAIDSQCLTSSSGTILIGVTPLNGTTYVGNAYVYVNNTARFLDQEYKDYPENVNFGSVGVFGMVILTIIAVVVGLRYPEWMVINMGLALLLGDLANFHNLGYGVSAAVLVAGVIVAWTLNKRNG